MKTTRYIAKCKQCGTTMSALSDGHDARYGKDQRRSAVYTGNAGNYFSVIVIDCTKCGQGRLARAVDGKVSHRHVCGAKCLASKGPTCECSCGGKNHGASYEVAS